MFPFHQAVDCRWREGVLGKHWWGLISCLGALGLFLCRGPDDTGSLFLWLSCAVLQVIRDDANLRLRIPRSRCWRELALSSWLEQAFTAATPGHHLCRLLNFLNDGYRQEHDLQISGGWWFHGRQIWRGSEAPQFLHSPGKSISSFSFLSGVDVGQTWTVVFSVNIVALKINCLLSCLWDNPILAVLSASLRAPAWVNPGRNYTFLLMF